MLRFVAYDHHFVDSLRYMKANGSADSVGFTSAGLQKVETTLWSIAQSKAFLAYERMLGENGTGSEDNSEVRSDITESGRRIVRDGVS